MSYRKPRHWDLNLITKIEVNILNKHRPKDLQKFKKLEFFYKHGTGVIIVNVPESPESRELIPVQVPMRIESLRLTIHKFLSERNIRWEAA